MSISLPPSARDFQIYQRLLLDGASTRQAAADFSLSQTRVRQIAQHVVLWLAHSLPPSCEATDAAYLRLALHIAADRLQLIYGEAMHGWRATHQSKYAGVILRVTAAMGKMPVTSGALDALLADALEGPLPDDPYENTISREQTCSRYAETPFTTHPPRTNEPTLDLGTRTLDGSPSTPHSALCTPQSSPPPSRDCSPTPISPPSATQPAAPSPAVTPSTPVLSNAVPRTIPAARRAFLAPAHQPPGAGPPTPPKTATASLTTATEPEMAITEPQITPQTLGFSTINHSSRRDRRRLRRLAASK